VDLYYRDYGFEFLKKEVFDSLLAGIKEADRYLLSFNIGNITYGKYLVFKSKIKVIEKVSFASHKNIFFLNTSPKFKVIENGAASVSQKNTFFLNTPSLADNSPPSSSVTNFYHLSRQNEVFDPSSDNYTWYNVIDQHYQKGFLTIKTKKWKISFHIYNNKFPFKDSVKAGNFVEKFSGCVKCDKYKYECCWESENLKECEIDLSEFGIPVIFDLYKFPDNILYICYMVEVKNPARIENKKNGETVILPLIVLKYTTFIISRKENGDVRLGLRNEENI